MLPADSRFSLGLIPNINRRDTAEYARRYLGNGITLELQREGDGSGYTYSIMNESECSVFVQSAACSLKNQWHMATVVKVPTRQALEIFSESYFRNYMTLQRQRGYQEALSCTRLCTIRISFVKGWGERYRRQVKRIKN